MYIYFQVCFLQGGMWEATGTLTIHIPPTHSNGSTHKSRKLNIRSTLPPHQPHIVSGRFYLHRTFPDHYCRLQQHRSCGVCACAALPSPCYTLEIAPDSSNLICVFVGFCASHFIVWSQYSGDYASHGRLVAGR